MAIAARHHPEPVGDKVSGKIIGNRERRARTRPRGPQRSNEEVLYQLGDIQPNLAGAGVQLQCQTGRNGHGYHFVATVG